jgi:hypothetical protein
MRALDRREAISVFLCRPQICGGSVHATMIAERALQAIDRRTASRAAASCASSTATNRSALRYLGCDVGRRVGGQALAHPTPRVWERRAEDDERQVRGLVDRGRIADRRRHTAKAPLRLRIRRQHLDDLVVDLVVLVGAGAILRQPVQDRPGGQPVAPGFLVKERRQLGQSCALVVGSLPESVL